MRFVTLCLILALCLPCLARAEEKAAESVFERVMRTRTIQCGYIPYEPSVMKDPNTGAMSGIVYDLMEEIGRRLDMKIVWTVESSYGTYSEDIKKPNVDMMCTAFWAMAETGQFGIIGIPLWYSGLGIFVRADDTRFDGDYKKLNAPDYTIASIDGAIPGIIAKQDFPRARITSMPPATDYGQMMLDVIHKKADATIVERSIAAKYMQGNQHQVKNLVPENPVRVYANSILVRAGETDMLNFVNMAMTELMNEGYVDKLLDKYEPAPDSFYRAARPYKP